MSQNETNGASDHGEFKGYAGQRESVEIDRVLKNYRRCYASKNVPGSGIVCLKKRHCDVDPGLELARNQERWPSQGYVEMSCRDAGDSVTMLAAPAER